MTYIYKATIVNNNKVYIGKANNVLERWRRHIRASRRLDTYFYRAIRKYGVSNVKIDIIEECINVQQANLRERYWINHYKSNNTSFGYNMTEGGDGGKIVGEAEERRRKSLSGKNNPNFGKPTWAKGLTIETDERVKRSIEHLTKVITGRKQTQEHIDKRVKKQIGKKRTKEWCEAQSLRKIKWWDERKNKVVLS